MKPVRAVGAVVYRINPDALIEVLLIRKRGGMWSLPKGKLKTAESHDQALLREIQEETGIHGQVEELIAEATYAVEKKAVYTKIVTYYLVRSNGGTLRPDHREQIEEVVWVPLATAFDYLKKRQRHIAILRCAQSLIGAG